MNDFDCINHFSPLNSAPTKRDTVKNDTSSNNITRAHLINYMPAHIHVFTVYNSVNLSFTHFVQILLILKRLYHP